MTFSQDKQAAAASAESEQSLPEPNDSSKDISAEVTNAPVDEAFDLDDFDDEFDDDFESEVEGEYELEDDIYAEQLSNILDIDIDELKDEFDEDNESSSNIDAVEDTAES